MTHSNLVFVYGTLKKGEPNHYWLTSPENGISNFKDVGYTVVKYPLIIATRYNIPFLLDKSDHGNYVEGEIYEVDDKMMSNLDILEDHPNYYERRLESIRMSVTSEVVQCWVYFLKNFKTDLLNKDMFTVYSSKGEHKLEYCERYLRDPTFDHKTEILQQ